MLVIFERSFCFKKNNNIWTVYGFVLFSSLQTTSSILPVYASGCFQPIRANGVICFYRRPHGFQVLIEDPGLHAHMESQRFTCQEWKRICLQSIQIPQNSEVYRKLEFMEFCYSLLHHGVRVHSIANERKNKLLITFIYIFWGLRSVFCHVMMPKTYSCWDLLTLSV